MLFKWLHSSHILSDSFLYVEMVQRILLLKKNNIVSKAEEKKDNT